MWNLVKKILATLIVLFIVCYTLNLHIAGRPTRDYVSSFWNNPKVQRVYNELSYRFKALLNKDISVEEVFTASPPKSETKSEARSELEPKARTEVPNNQKKSGAHHISKKDKKKLEKILRAND